MSPPTDAGRVAALVGLLFGLAGMGSAAVAVTLPAIAADLDLSTGGASWVISLYALMLAVATAVYGRVADLAGIRLPLLVGVGLMGSAVMLLFFMPWLDRCRVKSIRYRSWIYKIALMAFAITFVTLGYLGLQPATGAVPTLSLVFTILYFAFFLFMPFYTRIEKTKPVPTRVTW